MKQVDDAVLERLAGLARASEPPDLPDAAAASIVRNAMGAAGTRLRRRRVASITLGAMAAAAVVALGISVGLRLGGSESSAMTVASAQPLRMRLPTGDALTATPGARFRLESTTVADRRIALEEGTMLAQVERLGRGNRFEVVTAHLRARALGTIFSVQTTADSSVVRVFEGRVEVLEQGRRRVLTADQELSAGGEPGPIDDGAPLAGEGRLAAAGRMAEAFEPDSTPPSGAEPTTIAAEPMPANGPSAAAAGSPGEEEPTTAEARRWIAGGEAARALRAARRALSQGGAPGHWRMLEADSLRALGRYDEAARSYEEALSALQGPAAAEAGYLAAAVRHARLGDREGALGALDRGRADAPGSPLEERALGLRARILFEQGRTAEARAAAERYLARFPEGGLAQWMSDLLASP